LSDRDVWGDPKNMNALVTLIFIVTVLAIAILTVQLKVIELKEGDSGDGDGNGGDGDGDGEGEGKGAGEGTDAGAGGTSGAGEFEKVDLGYDPGAGGGGGLGDPEEEPTVNRPEEEPDTEPEDKGFLIAGKAVGRSAEADEGTAGGKTGLGKSTAGGGGGGGNGNTGIPQIVLPEKVKWLLVVLVFLALGTAVTYLARSYMKAREAALKKRTPRKKRKRRKLPEAMVKSVAKEFIETIEMTYDALADMEDIRKAVRLCYVRLCKVISDKGISRSPDLTPREFYRTCSKTFEIKSPAMRNLTVLFEEAVFSEHPMDEKHRDEALNLLKRAVKEVEGW
jgi:hypothetical protein